MVSLKSDWDFDNLGTLLKKSEKKGLKYKKKKSVLRAANLAFYFSLISYFYLALQFSCMQSVSTTTAALVSVIF